MMGIACVSMAQVAVSPRTPAAMVNRSGGSPSMMTVSRTSSSPVSRNLSSLATDGDQFPPAGWSTRWQV
jgi:hypothetical protein